MFDINLDFLHKIIHRSVYKNNGEKKEKYLYDKWPDELAKAELDANYKVSGGLFFDDIPISDFFKCVTVRWPLTKNGYWYVYAQYSTNTTGGVENITIEKIKNSELDKIFDKN